MASLHEGFAASLRTGNFSVQWQIHNIGNQLYDCAISHVYTVTTVQWQISFSLCSPRVCGTVFLTAVLQLP